MKTGRLAITLYAVFALSGFSGLIYESIWSHYLKLFLGHAAYSQVLVLAIFMGGMGLGAWLTSRYVSRFRNLLLLYALVEGIIGVCGLGFHSFFVSLLAFSYDSVFPSLTSPFLVQLYKWLICGAIILPQSILLGSTFPLMSNGLIRLFAGNSGYSLSMLYFTNSIGAAIGVLTSGFYLIEKAGLPGTILIAGVINILIALVVYLLASDLTPGAALSSKARDKLSSPRLLLVAAFITGAASFIYEIAWLRMLSMVLGASTHAFELMLSAFIFGLAFGSYWIRKRIDKIAEPLKAAGFIQILMGIFALLTLPLYNYTFNLMSFFIDALDTTESGYVLFNMLSHILVLLVMLPATFCAGMTLPLFTNILIKKDYGEKGIGQIYACNTFGAICGVVFIVLLGMPYLGLKGSMLFGSGLDIALGLVLIAVSVREYSSSRLGPTPAIVLGILLVFSFLFIELDVSKMTAGVFRYGAASQANSEVLFYKDGKTASISITKLDDVIALRTNGKPDAGINVAEEEKPTGDEYTMTLLGALPIAHHPRAKTVASIGMGSGLTSHTLLAWPGFTNVDTIEIESAVVDAARYFGKRVENVFDDPRSKIYIEDAKTFFSNNAKKYDIVISEPSNPWVSGVSSLFTEEFYDVIKKHLNENGLFVQWIHSYEIDRKLLLSVLKAMSTQFKHYKIYAPNHVDLIILASESGEINALDGNIFDVDSLRHELNLINISNINDLNIRFLGDNAFFGAYIEHGKNVINSDYFPILDHQSPRTRFLRSQADDFYTSPGYYLPVLQMYYPWLDEKEAGVPLNTRFLRHENSLRHAQEILLYVAEKAPQINDRSVEYYVDLLKRHEQNCSADSSESDWIEALFTVMHKTLAYLQPLESRVIYQAIVPKCDDSVSELQKLWLQMFIAIAQRDRAFMIATGEEILRTDSRMSPEQKRFIASAVLLAHVVEHNFNAASEFWQQHQGDILMGSSSLETAMIMLLASVQAFADESAGIELDLN